MEGAGYIKHEDITVFPEAQTFAGALLKQEPYSLRQLHWHPLADEWQFMLNGSVDIQVFNGSGLVYNGTLREGEVGFIPKGTGHYLKNESPDPAYYVVVFNNPEFSTVELHSFMGTMPIEVCLLFCASC